MATSRLGALLTVSPQNKWGRFAAIQTATVPRVGFCRAKCPGQALNAPPIWMPVSASHITRLRRLRQLRLLRIEGDLPGVSLKWVVHRHGGAVREPKAHVTVSRSMYLRGCLSMSGRGVTGVTGVTAGACDIFRVILRPAPSELQRRINRALSDPRIALTSAHDLGAIPADHRALHPQGPNSTSLSKPALCVMTRGRSRMR